MKSPAYGMARLGLAAAAACHLLVFSAAPLLHSCGHARPADSRFATCPCRAAAPARPWFAGAARGCRLCGLLGGSCAACNGRSGASRKGPATPAVGGTAWADGVCLACLYLQNAQSGSPPDSARPAVAPVQTPPAYPPVASDANRWLLSFDHPARAPPAAA